MKKNLYLLAFSLILFLVSCDTDDPHDHNENEVITRLELLMVSSNCLSVSAVASDPDGEGGNSPKIDTITLGANCEYIVNLRFADETKSPQLDITSEIFEEGDEHLICFEVKDGLSDQQCTITLTDQDVKGNKIGLKSIWRTGNAGAGKVKIELKHQPDGKKNGTCEPGDTDVSVEFVTVIR